MIRFPSNFWGAISATGMLLGAVQFLEADKIAPERFWKWHEVAIGGGGWVTGIEISRKTPRNAFVRTDVGGAFKWNEEKGRWNPLAPGTDPEEQFQQNADDFTSISGLAIDPQDDQVIYIATGAYMADWARSGRLYKSVDGGDSFNDITPVQWRSPDSIVRLAGNDGDARFTGERIAVSPDDSDLVFVATPRDGLWKTENSNSSTAWRKTSLPRGAGEDGLGITSLSWVPTKGGRLFASAYGIGIFFTQDNGENWTKMESSPRSAMRIVAVSNDVVWVAAEDGLWKWEENQWRNFSAKTESGRFTAVAVDTRDPNRVVAASGVGRKWKESLYRTSDGGRTWELIVWEVARDDETWMPEDAIATAPTDLAFDPFVPNMVWLAHGFGASRTEDIFAETVKWHDLNKGIEETCVFDLAAPPGTPLLSSVADLTGFLHDHGLEYFPTLRFMDRPFHERYMDSTGFAYSKQLAASGCPQVIYRGANGRDWKIKQPGKDHRLRALMMSTDGGATWSKVNEWFAGGGEGNNGYPIRIEVSAGNAGHLFSAFDGYYAYSRDGGETWARSSGTPGALGGPWIFSFPIGSDQIETDVFYVFNQGVFATSRDGGRSFVSSSTPLPKCSPGKDFVQVCGDPRRAGRVWLGLARRFDRRGEHAGGLFVSDDFGTTFRKLASIGEVIGFDIGVPESPENPHPIYLYGWVSGTKGLWMSVNDGLVWTRIDGEERSLAKARFLRASKDEFGLVFIGTNGSGILRGKMSGTPKGKAWENAPKPPGEVRFRDRQPPSKTTQ